MAIVKVNPAYTQLLNALDLTAPENFLDLAGVICSGHPDRHVMELTLTAAEEKTPVILKKEHCVRWRDRWQSTLAGYGWSSKSIREFTILERLQEVGMPVPEPLATGEDGSGRAFLLLRRVEPAIDLRIYLSQRPSVRVRVAEAVAKILADMHQAGFHHRDLYAKHFLVRPYGSDNFALVILDWQRANKRRVLPWSARLQDLAALWATLAEDILPTRARTALLQTYIDRCIQTASQLNFPSFASALEQIRHCSQQLLKKRRIREMRRLPLAPGEQNLIWLDGEAMCVTRQFYERMHGRLPNRLTRVYQPLPPPGNLVSESAALSTTDHVLLTRRTSPYRLTHWWNRWRGNATYSEEFRNAATIFRLERFGVKAPRLCAMGQKFVAKCRLSSFLLTEPPKQGACLLDWLRQHKSSDSTCRASRQHAIISAAKTLRAIHEAGCVLGRQANLYLYPSNQGGGDVGIDTVAGMRLARRIQEKHRAADLRRLLSEFSICCSRTELLRFYLSYTNQERLNPSCRRRLYFLLQLVPGPENPGFRRCDS